MSTVLNDIDVFLQSSADRFTIGGDRFLLLGASANAINVPPSGAPIPATVTFTATLLALHGDVTFTTVPAGIPLTVVANIATLDCTQLETNPSISVTASVTTGGLTYTTVPQTVVRITNGSVGARGAGHFYATSSSWDDAAATAACPGGAPVLNDVVTLHNGSVWALTKSWSGTAWVVLGAVYDGSLFVTGSIGAAALDVIQLDAITATIGTLRTATTGGRTEIKDNLISVFDTTNVVRVKIGNTLLT